ncbi:hypothetical protein LCGC14_1533350 [marine sediment metagenome]|uniref:Uncharacterized protein n=1 Tax=marine sediment metagenome TaxID=412755 RepID=A0A0F9IVF0_9ZZZZ
MIDPINITADAILWNKLPIHFFYKKRSKITYLSAIEVKASKMNCGYVFTINPPEQPDIIGIMMPRIGEIIIDDFYLDHQTLQFYCPYGGDVLQKTHSLGRFDVPRIDTPIVHLIHENAAYAWSCPSECIITCGFQYQYESYINIEAVATLPYEFTLDISTNYLINLQRYPTSKKQFLINKYTPISTIKKAILNGGIPRSMPSNPDQIIESARILQQLIKSKDNIQSAIIGSLARRLNGINVDVNDIDLMCYSKQDAINTIDTLSNIANCRWAEDGRGLLNYNGINVDICYDNFNVLPGSNFARNRHGLSFIDVEGLILMYAINWIVLSQNQPTKIHQDHLGESIYSLLNSLPDSEYSIQIDNVEIHDYSDCCRKLLNLLQDAQLQYRDLRINRPFMARLFQEKDTHYITIINNGSVNDVRIIIDFLPKKATWQDITGNTQKAKIDLQEDFCIIYLDQIYLPGVLIC